MNLHPPETYVGIIVGIITATILWVRFDVYYGFVLPADIAFTYGMGTFGVSLLAGLLAYVSLGGEIPE